jgi:uncharacterized membrane protein YoaK (UPF0700 family)
MVKPVGVARGPADSVIAAVGEGPGLLLAGLIAALAGMVDAIGYLRLSHLFVSFMSGNSTQLATALGQGDLSEAGVIAELIALFVLGAAAGQMLAARSGPWHLTSVLIAVALLLAIAALLAATPEPMVIAMGALNAAMHRAGKIAVSLTYVTGTLVKFGQSLGDFLTRRLTGFSWLAQIVPWLGLIAGATIGSAAYLRLGGAVTWIPVLMAGLLAVCSAVLPKPD